MHFLVTGGAGYIGSHIVKSILLQGHSAVILDNFSTGHRWATHGQEVLEVDLRDLSKLKEQLRGKKFDGVFHLAAKSQVNESNRKPLEYYQNNVGGTMNLLEAVIGNDLRRLVFSSTAAVYGNPISNSIYEDHPKEPINTYGHTKLIIERLLESTCRTHDFSAVSLRYFNAAGASKDGDIGESHDPETHLIPNALKSAAGIGRPLEIFGDDYPTPDGTCLRDYVHVLDLADAHIRAMNMLIEQKCSFETFNLGTGKGSSVKDVFSACEAIVGRPIPHTTTLRRDGDPSQLIANAEKANRMLDWIPTHSSISEIVSDAWAWEQSQIQILKSNKGNSHV